MRSFRTGNSEQVLSGFGVDVISARMNESDSGLGG